jgi:hypothetical protein
MYLFDFSFGSTDSNFKQVELRKLDQRKVLFKGILLILVQILLVAFYPFFSLFRMNRVVLLNMIFGSLICNILIYWISEKGDQLFFCNTGMMWLAYLNPLFEILKRLCSFNVLFSIVCNKKFMKRYMSAFEKPKYNTR